MKGTWLRSAPGWSALLAMMISGCPSDPVTPPATDAGRDAPAVDAPVTPDAPEEPDAPVEPDAPMEPDAGPPPPECTTDDDCDDGNACSGDETCGTDGNCADGTALADGDACDADAMPATRDISVDDACVATRCGDGFTDTTALEQCDDGNDVNGDGCDDCRFSCDADSDCADSETCNGGETCSAAHICVPGTNLANGTACAGGTGRCVAGTCLPNSCTTAADCDDGDACNGDETCGATGCAAGTAPSCDDGDACTADACVSPDGCESTLIDMDGDLYAPTSLGACGEDCDDTRFDVGPDAPELCGNGRDDDCDGMTDEVGTTTWYADCDTDGYAAAGARMLSSCTMPAPGMSLCATGGGWTARAPSDAANTDCNDGNMNVNPAQSMFQTTAISGAPAASDFDYNCDTNEERRTTTTGSCVVASLTACTLTEGWATTTPACGARANWVIGCTRNLAGCTTRTEERQQACR